MFYIYVVVLSHLLFSDLLLQCVLFLQMNGFAFRAIFLWLKFAWEDKVQLVEV